MINEGAQILEEKIALRASDIDVIWINGYGWPAWRGGPMHYADSLGLRSLVSNIEYFQSAFGETFKPAPLLATLAAQGGAFAGWGR